MSSLTSAVARSWSTRLLVRERRLHLLLPRRVGAERVALRRDARAAYSASSSSARSATALRTRCFVRSHSVAAELRELRPLAARVARDPRDLLDRHEDPVAGREATARGSRAPRRSRCRAGASARSGRRRGRCGRRGRRRVSRSRMSRGTTRRIAFGRRTRTVPNSSRSVTKTRPSGPPGEAVVQAAARRA